MTLRSSCQDFYDCYEVLQQVFGHSDFKGKQKAIVEAAVAGRDVFVLAPTGMGKSLCFQLPAVMSKTGATLVISPLCSLMLNQVDNLRSKGVKVVSWTSETSSEERREIEEDLLSDIPLIRLLYISPEKYATADCTRLLDAMHRNRNLNRLVIDEAHCISEWGHSFRSDYRRLGKFRDRYVDIPIMALTATATQTVQRDIVFSLKMDQDNLFYALHPFNRDNLYYEVRYMSMADPQARMQEIFEYITLLYQRRKRASSGIIYCRAKATCDSLSGFLRGKGLNVKPYHRGISPGTLKETLKKWSAGGHGDPGGVDIVVATIAFGLGIDKGDVRYIIHYDLPTSFEGYYQETGRAGRDGQPSKCILYYSREDAARTQDLVTTSDPNRLKDAFDGPSPTQRATNSIQALIQYAENVTTCRHITICRYFGEEINDADPNVLKTYCDAMCDACKYPQKTQLRLKILTPSSAIVRRDPHKQNQGMQEKNKPLSGPQQDRVSMNPDEHKRGYPDDSGTSSRSVKKAKIVSTRPLTTMPFESAGGLKKPFKPPSMILARPQPNHHTAERILHKPEDPVDEKLAELADHVESEPNTVEPAPKSPAHEITLQPAEPSEVSHYLHVVYILIMGLGPVEPFDNAVELENETSEKVALAQRRSGFQAIRKSLSSADLSHVAGLSRIGPANSKNWDQLLYNASRDIEWDALSLSCTPDGYQHRIYKTVQAIVQLSGTRGSDYEDDMAEDVDEIMGILQRWGAARV